MLPIFSSHVANKEGEVESRVCAETKKRRMSAVVSACSSRVGIGSRREVCLRSLGAVLLCARSRILNRSFSLHWFLDVELKDSEKACLSLLLLFLVVLLTLTSWQYLPPSNHPK